MPKSSAMRTEVKKNHHRSVTYGFSAKFLSSDVGLFLPFVPERDTNLCQPSKAPLHFQRALLDSEIRHSDSITPCDDSVSLSFLLPEYRLLMPKVDAPVTSVGIGYRQYGAP